MRRGNGIPAKFCQKQATIAVHLPPSPFIATWKNSKHKLYLIPTQREGEWWVAFAFIQTQGEQDFAKTKIFWENSSNSIVVFGRLLIMNRDKIKDKLLETTCRANICQLGYNEWQACLSVLVWLLLTVLTALGQKFFTKKWGKNEFQPTLNVKVWSEQKMIKLFASYSGWQQSLLRLYSVIISLLYKFLEYHV